VQTSYIECGVYDAIPKFPAGSTPAACALEASSGDDDEELEDEVEATGGVATAAAGGGGDCMELEPGCDEDEARLHHARAASALAAAAHKAAADGRPTILGRGQRAPGGPVVYGGTVHQVRTRLFRCHRAEAMAGYPARVEVEATEHGEAEYVRRLGQGVQLGAGGGKLPPADKLRAENFPADNFTDDAEALEDRFTMLMGYAPGGVFAAAAGGGGAVDLRDSDGSEGAEASAGSDASAASIYLDFADLAVGMRVESKVGGVYSSAVVQHVDEHAAMLFYTEEKFDDWLELGALQPPACVCVSVCQLCVSAVCVCLSCVCVDCVSAVCVSCVC
jgi:hypothetical protein